MHVVIIRFHFKGSILWNIAFFFKNCLYINDWLARGPGQLSSMKSSAQVNLFVICLHCVLLVLKHSQVGVGPVVRGREPTQNQMLRWISGLNGLKWEQLDIWRHRRQLSTVFYFCYPINVCEVTWECYVWRRSMGDCVDIHGPYRANRRSEQLATSLQPLHIHNGLSHPPRASTLRECELIIRQLYNTNSLQSQEVRGRSPKCLPPICVSQLTRRHLCLLDSALQGIAERYCAPQEDHPRKLQPDQSLPCGWYLVKHSRTLLCSS